MMDEGGGASRSTDPAAGTSSATDVSLREYLIALIERDKFNVRVVGAMVCGFGMFAWFQVQRRLEILNHENERLLAQQEKTVSRDTYIANESQRKEERADLSKWMVSVDQDRIQAVTRDEFQRDQKQDKRQGISTGTAIIGTVVAVIVVVLGILNYQALHKTNVNVTDTTPTVTVTVPSK